MYFKLGKEYIVKVTEDGIIPVEEFNSERFFDKDHDSLNFLTDKEKRALISTFADNLAKKMDRDLQFFREDLSCKSAAEIREQVNDIIRDHYKSYLNDIQ